MVRMGREDVSGAGEGSLVTAWATGGMTLASFESLSASRPEKIGFQLATYLPLHCVMLGRNCWFSTMEPAKRKAVAQKARSFPTTTPSPRVCLSIQLQRNSTVSAGDSLSTVTFQDFRVEGATLSGGWAISGLEGTGLLFMVGCQTAMGPIDFLSDFRLNPAS